MKNNNISMSRLAKLCGFSQGTVDRALNNRDGISAKTKDYILSVAKEYGYRSNYRTGNKLIGIIVFDLYNEYFSELVMLLEKELRLHGYCSLVMFSDKNKETERECIETMYNAGVDGIILCPINTGKEFAEYLKSWNIPIVTVGNKIENIKYIGIDNFSAMYDLTKLVISKNYHNIIYFSPVVKSEDFNTYAQTKRYYGFKEAIESEQNVEWAHLSDLKALKDYLTDNSAIIASTDVYALKILFSEEIPDCFVVGFDNIPSIYNYNIPLISVGTDKKKHAEAVVEYILFPTDSSEEYINYSIDKK